MSKRSISLLLLLAAVGAAAAYWYWQTMQQQAAPVQAQASVIASTEVVQEQWQPALQAVGSLQAIHGINVSTEVSGIISEIVFISGQSVRKGQILIKLDDSVDRALLEALRADQELASVQFNRFTDLLKRKVTSKSEYDEAQANFDAARARVKQQEEIVKRKVIRAPFAGLAGIRQVDLGQYIDAGDPIVSLQALNPIYVDYSVAERHIARISNGQTVQLQLDAVPDRVFDGKVQAVNSGIDTGTRTLKVRAILDNPDSTLRPGMFAQVETITGEAEPVLTLPRTAISFNSYGNFVYVINEDDQGSLTVKRTAVETGEVRAGRVAVSGLPKDTRVVRSGLVKLRDGVAVSIDNQVELDDAEISGE